MSGIQILGPLGLILALNPFVKSMNLAVIIAAEHRQAWEEVYVFNGCSRLEAGRINLDEAKEILLLQGQDRQEVLASHKAAGAAWQDSQPFWRDYCMDISFSRREALFYKESADEKPAVPNWRFRPNFKAGRG